MTNGIHFGASRAMILDMEVVNASLPARPMREKALTSDEIKMFPFSVWGDNNLKPQEMAADIKITGGLTGIINLKARLALCEGLVPAIIKSDEQGQRVIDKIVDDPEIWKFLEASDHFTQTAGWMKDIIGMANAACRFMMDKEGKRIVAFQRDDITELRYEKKNKQGQINNVYYCAEWDKIYGSYEDNKVFTLPLLRRWAPWDHVKELAESNVREFVMTFRYPGWGEHYYSTPLWYSAYKWVKIAQAVPEMKAAMFDIVMRPAWMVTIYEGFWQKQYSDWDEMTEPAEKEARKAAFFLEVDNKLIGKSNAGKNIYVAGEMSMEYGKAQSYIEFKAMETPVADGEMLPDAAAANSEIAFAEMMNLALVGGNQSAGPYTKNEGGSNIREGSLFQVVITELERRFIRHIMNVVKYVNGWDAKYPGLEFIIPATALTTLDTGAGSKPINTGGFKEKSQDSGAGSQESEEKQDKHFTPAIDLKNDLDKIYKRN
jgi:hypothetical protein